MNKKIFKNIDIFDGEKFFRGTVVVSGSMIEKVSAGDIGVILSDEYEAISGDYILMPGMINLHTHIPMTLFKGVSEDLPLEKWLERIFPLEAKFISPEMVYICGMWGMAELLRSGVTTFSDMYFFEESVAKAAMEINIKAVLGEGVINFPAPNGKNAEQTIEYTE
ncbi:MAG TPA: amidohydrolase family protein, partial [bacterium]|nr:amidohydrolase family protein [bacterium]